MDVHAFLFTDMVLLTKLKKTEKFKVVKPVNVMLTPSTKLLTADC